MRTPASLVLAALLGLLLTSLPLHAARGEGRDARKKLVMLIAEHEYETATTLPKFAAEHLQKDFKVVTVTGSLAPGETAFDGIEALADADVLLVSVRRRTPPKAQLDLIRRHVSSGKPVIGIRTASHAFSLSRNQTLEEGNAEWPTFDAEVLGGNYLNHHGNQLVTTVTAAEPGRSSPLLRGVSLPFKSESSLYRNTPLRPGARPILKGEVEGKPPEPVAWTFTRADGGRTFYTSLGGPGDFKKPAFVQLLRNGIEWATR